MSALEKVRPNALAKGREKQRAQIGRMLDTIAARAIKQVHGLFLKEGEPGYNADAERVWSDVSTRTRVAVDVYKETMAGKRDDKAAAVQLGVLILKERLDAGNWEQHALTVDREEREKLAKQVIDVEAKAP